MRSWLAAFTVLGLVAVSAVAGALPGLPEIPAYQPPDRGEIESLAEEAADAAGLDGGSGAVPPVIAPVGDLGRDLPALAVAGLALLGAASLATFAFFLGGARFVTPTEVLANDVRQAIYGYLKVHVGANLKQITDDLRLTTTNAIWHLRKLEESGLIHSRRFNGYKVFYPAEGGIEARRMSLGKTALANENAQEVFEHVVLHPGTHQREIARALGVNHGTVRWHLKKLMSAELIVETRRGKASAYEPTPMGLAALREVGPSRVRAPVSEPVVTAA